MRKIISLLLTLCIILSALTMNVAAAETFTYKISATTTTPKIGEEFEVTISLTNYANISSEIRGLQIDVTNIDTSVVEVISHSSMFEDETAASNKTSYQINKNLVRYVYLHLSGSIDKSVTDIMKFRLKIKDDLMEAGSITLPIVLKIGTMDKQSITINESLTIDYSKESSTKMSVDVTWGSMEFIYDDGVWDDEKHRWVNGGWKPSTENSNLITVKNTGTTNAKVALSYNPLSSYDELNGIFVDSSNTEIDSSISLIVANQEQKYWFNLTGNTQTRWADDYVTVGSITLTITE